MPGHPSSSLFFSATPVFGRAEFAEAVGRRPGDRAITELLRYHLRAGNIRRISRGVFASVRKGTHPAPTTVDRLLAASRLRPGAVIAYQSALELHGCPMIQGTEVQLIASGEPGCIDTVDFACRFVRPTSPCSLSDGVTTFERQGVSVNATTLERTLVDLFHRYDLAGGAEGLFGSLDLMMETEVSLNLDALVGFAGRLGNATAIGVLGFWLDRERHALGIEAAEALEELRSLAPRHAAYALGATPGHGRAATGWNVILPADIVERYFDD